MMIKQNKCKLFGVDSKVEDGYAEVEYFLRSTHYILRFAVEFSGKRERDLDLGLLDFLTFLDLTHPLIF